MTTTMTKIQSSFNWTSPDPMFHKRKRDTVILFKDRNFALFAKSKLENFDLQITIPTNNIACYVPQRQKAVTEMETNSGWTAERSLH